ncbi:MAG: hypothetical protein ABFD90_06285 [Phycisphaerales bacterium]
MVSPLDSQSIATADGEETTLLNMRNQPDGSTLDAVKNPRHEFDTLRHELPPDMNLAFFYDQSLIAVKSVHSVWEAPLRMTPDVESCPRRTDARLTLVIGVA